jgi:site-specific recombinase XerD
MQTKINEFLAMPTRKSMVISDDYKRLVTSTFEKYQKKFETLSRANIIEYLNTSDYSQGSKYTIATTLCRFGREFDLLKENDINTIKRCFPKDRKEWSKENLKANDLDTILDTIIKRRKLPVTNLRDALSIALLSSFGMRVGQLIAMQRDDIRIIEDKIVVALIRQKHNKFDRSQGDVFKVSLPMNYKVGQYNLKTLLLRYKELLPQDSPALIYGKTFDAPMTTAGMRKVIKKIGEDIHMPDLHPHVFRHYVGTKLTIEYGVEVACAMLNHAAINTTKTYLNKESILDKIK